MQFSSETRSASLLWLALFLCALVLAGCGSGGSDPAAQALAKDPQKAAAAGQAGAAADAANQEARRADEARRAAQKK